MLQRVEGRFNDCLVLADGRVVSPYRLTCAIEKVPGILQFQLVQTDLNRVQLKLIAKNTKTNNMDTALIRRTLRSILGDDMHISVDLQKSLDPQPGEKFRVVECRVTTGPT
jgi:phenylacetate-CoA ligase